MTSIKLTEWICNKDNASIIADILSRYSVINFDTKARLANTISTSIDSAIAMLNAIPDPVEDAQPFVLEKVQEQLTIAINNRNALTQQDYIAGKMKEFLNAYKLTYNESPASF